jgi:hypothetical protein
MSESMSNEPYVDLDNLTSTHKHEEDLRIQSLALIRDNPEWRGRLILIERALALIFAFTHDYSNQSDDELTIQLFGIRLFNTGASALKLSLSGYSQQGLSLIRDIIEVGFLLDYFRSWPGKISEWKVSTDSERMKKFSPKHIRAALDKRDGNVERKRAAVYGVLSKLASHATYDGFRMNTKENTFVELGPFIHEKQMRAFLEEMVLRLGPVAVLYGLFFPGAPTDFVQFRESFAAELVGAVQKSKAK